MDRGFGVKKGWREGKLERRRRTPVQPESANNMCCYCAVFVLWLCCYVAVLWCVLCCYVVVLLCGCIVVLLLLCLGLSVMWLCPVTKDRGRGQQQHDRPQTSHQPHLYQTTAPLHPHPPLTQPDPNPVTSHPHPLYHPLLPHIEPPPYHPYPNNSAVVPACAPSPLPPPPSSPPPLYTTLPRRTLTSTGQANL